MSRRIFLIIFLCVFFVMPLAARAATLSVSPSTGTFSVGSTFDVSVLLDTNGKSVNAIALALQFPPDMLQVVSPSTGQSIIGVWTAAPKFDNLTGRVDLQGGIPGGITASGGLVTTLTFRVKSVGQAIVKFLDSSKVLQNDGLGTNVLTQTANAVYQFKLPAPAGPTLASETNPDQATWYPNRTVSFRFASDAPGIKGYSYILSDDPTTIPDDISEGMKDSVSYTNLSDGTHYFHIKSLRDGTWGGTTHYAVKIDGTPPAAFKIDIAPSSRTSSHQPIIQFSSSDALSGVDHYELKIVPLTATAGNGGGSTGTFFIEEMSPYVPATLELGDYDVIVRAYDKAHNYQEVTQHLAITTPVFALITSDGLKLGDQNIPWVWVILVGLVLIGVLAYVLYRASRWHRNVHRAREDRSLPKNVADQLEELKRYRAKYGVKALMIMFAFATLAFHTARADTVVAPPLITTISNNISNQEIFYAGGKTDFADENVVLYLQNLATGETFSQNIQSDNKGDWFYRHSSFLSPGSYLLWAQGKLGQDLSPPGPQVKMTVNRTAVQFGGSRISYETIYLFVIIILLIAIVALGTFIALHVYRGRKKHKAFQREVKEAEESVKRGFAVLRRDIEAELAVVKSAKLSGALSKDEHAKEKELLHDLETVQTQLGKEIWDLESVG